MRLLKNKLLIYNLIAAVFYILGSNGYMTYLTKYMEVQFNQSSSDATIFTGPITIFGMILGYLGSGYVISKFKPTPRKLFFWNVLVGVFYIMGQFSYTYLSCDVTNSLTVNDTWTIPTECNSHCKCNDIAYSPVCHVATRQTFFSACHAGCQSYNEKEKTYSKCSCSGNNSHFNRSIIHKKTLATNELDAQSMTEKVLIFRPIEESTTAHYGAIDVTKFAELERNLSTGNPEEDDYDVMFDDNQKDWYKNQQSLRKERSVAVDDDLVTPGVCAGNCASAYFAFSIISLIINCLGSTGRIGNILLSFR